MNAVQRFNNQRQQSQALSAGAQSAPSAAAAAAAAAASAASSPTVAAAPSSTASASGAGSGAGSTAASTSQNSFVNNLLLKTSPTIVNSGHMRLFVPFYTDSTDKYHNVEMRDCLTRNATASYFDEVHIVCVDAESESFIRANYPDTVKVHRVSARPTYKVIMNIAETDASDGDINILANSDIIFTPSILLLRYIEMTNTAVCLQRWEQENERVSIHIKNNVQDVWCWKNQIEDIDSFDFLMGVPSCDNRLAYELKSMGYNIVNPCVDIVTVHSHKNRSRDSSVRSAAAGTILSPYEYPTTCVLNFDKFRKRDLTAPFSFRSILHVGNTTPELSMQFEKSCRTYKHILSNDKANTRISDLIMTFTPDLVFLNFDEPGILSTHTILRLRCMRAYIISWSSRKLPFVDLHLTKDAFRPSFAKDVFNPVGPFILDHPDIVILHPPGVPEQVLADLKTTYGPKILIQDKTTIGELKQAELYRSSKIAVVFNDAAAPPTPMIDQCKEVAGCGVLCLSQTASPDDIGDVSWSTIADMREQIDKYLKNDADRIRIAKTACLRVHRYQTWANRVTELQQLASASPNLDLELV